MPRHAIVTSCDARFGDFLLRHWLPSLRANVNLSGVDVVVLDYGLADAQRQALSAQDVGVYPCVRDGVISNVRYRDICRLLDERDYDQILSVDAGDVIFQADVRPLFDQHPDRFRAVPEQRRIPFHELLIERSDLAPERFREILAFLGGKPMVNAGVVFGPARKFREFWHFYRDTSRAFGCFGMDQMLLNYVLYRDGFVALERGYNFVLLTAASRWAVRDGVFVDAGGHAIPVVHNAGNVESMRAIRDFGYRGAANRRRRLAPLRLRLLIARRRVAHLLRPPRH
ncbi:MAG: hypothetical protein KGL38_09315 [Gemmatimonadota bacterium]|nr:hypothetical protein [Gemmatimonadota bacterium]